MATTPTVTVVLTIVVFVIDFERSWTVIDIELRSIDVDVIMIVSYSNYRYTISDDRRTVRSTMYMYICRSRTDMNTIVTCVIYSRHRMRSFLIESII
jgi:hypothetical protein